jgi:hypothetical protein
VLHERKLEKPAWTENSPLKPQFLAHFAIVGYYKEELGKVLT